MKYLPQIHSQCLSEEIKNYLYSSMAAKIVKDYVHESFLQVRRGDVRPLEPVLEETLGFILAGGNNKSH